MTMLMYVFFIIVLIPHTVGIESMYSNKYHTVGNSSKIH